MTPDNIASKFFTEEQIKDVKLFGNGLINDTYRIDTYDAAYILQKINPTVFPEAEKIMHNLRVLHEHINSKNSNEVKLQIPAINNTLNNKTYFIDKNKNVWRVINFIDQSISIETIQQPYHAQQAGFALGHFHLLISNLNPDLLHDTLPGFHITPAYLEQYYQSINNIDLSHHASECRDFIQQHQHIANTLESAKHSGALPQRIIHGDPKLNNILFHQQHHKAISLIDLDTIKPGLLHYDIGDCLRSCCNTAQSETETAQFDLDICELILSGYFSETASFLTDQDYAYIFDAVLLITFELGIRFFTDYLQGNIYFKVSYAEQNLQRARHQFQQMRLIQQQQAPLQKLIQSLI